MVSEGERESAPRGRAWSLSMRRTLAELPYRFLRGAAGCSASGDAALVERGDMDHLEEGRRVRALRGTLVFYYVVGWMWALGFLLAYQKPGALVWQITMAHLAPLLWWGLHRNPRNVNVYSHLIVGLFLAGVSHLTWYSGGAQGANVAAFAVVAALAVLLVGSWGLLWIGACCGIVLTFFLLPRAGVSVPNVVPPEYRSRTRS